MSASGNVARRLSPPSMGMRVWNVLLITLLAAPVHAVSATAVRPNVILISIDTLRADHLGIYGYERDTSPNLDRFAQNAAVYDGAFAPAPWTLPSHAALLTGVHPARLGVVDIDSSLHEGTATLASHLAAAGYRTAAFVDSQPKGLLGAERGFSAGFDTYAHAPFVADAVYSYDARHTMDVGIRWLAANSGSPFFLFLHTKSVHAVPVYRGDTGVFSRPMTSP